MRNSLTWNNRTSVNVCILSALFTNSGLVELLRLNSNAIKVPRKTITQAANAQVLMRIYTQ